MQVDCCVDIIFKPCLLHSSQAHYIAHLHLIVALFVSEGARIYKPQTVPCKEQTSVREGDSLRAAHSEEDEKNRVGNKQCTSLTKAALLSLAPPEAEMPGKGAGQK